MKFFNEFKMKQEEAKPAEGDGKSTAAPTVEDLQKKLTEATESLNKVSANNKALLDEKTKALQAAKELREKAESEELANAQKDGNESKLLAIAQAQVEKYKSELNKFEDEKKDRAQKALVKAQEKAFEELFKDAEFHDINTAKKIASWSKIVPEKNEDGKITFNADGLAQVKDELVNKHGYLFKAKAGEADRTKSKVIDSGKSNTDLIREELKAIRSKSNDLVKK
jgi:small-conductance mechanosensitive channel